MVIGNDKRLTDTEWAIWEDTYDDGILCTDCVHCLKTHEPHGEVIRHCTAEDPLRDCIAVENYHLGYD